MIKEYKINGLLFQEQTTFRIYKSEEDRTKGIFQVAMSSKKDWALHKRWHRKRAIKKFFETGKDIFKALFIDP